METGAKSRKTLRAARATTLRQPDAEASATLPRRTQRHFQKLRTRRRLQTSARSLFANGGYLTVTIDEIASDAGVSRAAFYLHYKSKRALLSDILSRELIWQKRRYRALKISSDPQVQEFEVWIRSFISGFEQGSDALSLFNFASSIEREFQMIASSQRDSFVLLLGSRNPVFRIYDAQGAVIERRRVSLNLLVLEIEQFASQAAKGVWPLDIDLSVSALAERFLGFVR